MAKRFGKGNDATQDVSLSQFVPPKPPARGNPKNDMSLWGGVVVGTSDFAPPVLRKPKPPSNRWKWIAGGGVVVAAAVIGFLIVGGGGGSKKTTTPSAAPAAAPSDKGSGSAPVAAKDDNGSAGSAAKPDKGAGSAATMADKKGSGSAGSGSAAGSAAGSGDGRGPTVASVTGEVDAISGVAPIIKAAKKKPTGRKVVKKAPKKAAPKRK